MVLPPPSQIATVASRRAWSRAVYPLLAAGLLWHWRRAMAVSLGRALLDGI